jgi:hypothetical protein
VPDEGLRDRLLDAAYAGLRVYERSGELRLPAVDWLAFLELGLAIGLAALPLLRASSRSARAERLAHFEPLAAEIVSFWLKPDHRSVRTWREHLNINDVMLATSLAPSSFLMLRN